MRERGLASWFRRWAELEEGAVILNTYECRSVPGLLECGRLPNVDIQIMPTASPEHAGTDGPFRLLETDEHEWLGYTEGQQSGQVISDPKDISLLHQRYAKLRIQALNPADSAGLLMRLRGSL
ncbi:Scr1 family TA system antitoxin-like transcriptional regulator [Streptomyces spororaveus]|uniref:Scr1 family TA system antitoxin-like transcriptional regulator n=1 Tax=Streptomyces spororaveus TaxID=284039 RepID=UPI00378FCB93